MRFRLRTLLVVFVLMCCTAPWWDDWRQDLQNWMSPPLSDEEKVSRVIRFVRKFEKTNGRRPSIGEIKSEAEALGLDEDDFKLTKYVLFRKCGSSTEAVKLQNVLSEHGIDVELRNDLGWSETPKHWTQVWVARDQFDKAVIITRPST